MQSQVKQSKEFDLNIPNCEDMWIQLHLGNNKNCIVGLIYRHPKQKLSVLNQPLKN